MKATTIIAEGRKKINAVMDPKISQMIMEIITAAPEVSRAAVMEAQEVPVVEDLQT